MEGQTDGWTDIQTDKHIAIKTNRLTEGWTEGQIGRLTGRQTDIKVDKQTDRGT
jgi:hypothetical protein